MKKLVRIFALVLTLALLLSAAPMAVASAAPKGKFEVVDKVSGITCTIDELGVATLTYENENIVQGEKYAVFVVALNPGFESNDDYTISKNDENGTLLYIGQIDSAPEAGKITFKKVYPINLADSVILITGEGLDPTKPVVARIKLNYTPGDVTGDGKVNMLDATQAARFAMNLSVVEGFVEPAVYVREGKVTMLNATLIARKAMKLITEFPIESNG